MAEKNEGKTPSSADENRRKNPSGDSRKVAKTRLEMEVSKLTDRQSAADDASAGDDSANKVAKTLLEADAPTLERIKQLAEAEAEADSNTENLSDSQKHSVHKTLLEPDVDVDSMTPEEFKAYRNKLARTIQDPRHEPVTEKNNSIKELAKTIPEPAKGNKKTEKDLSAPSFDSAAAQVKSESASEQEDPEGVSLKALAKTIPDPHMRERKAVAARIARIRSFQKNKEGKSDIFSKTVGASSLDVLDTLRDGSAGKASENSISKKSEQSDTSVPAKYNHSAPSVSSLQSSSTSKTTAPVREQFVAKTRLDHDILLQAVSDSKVREEARVAAILEEKAKEPPKPPPDKVRADKTASICPFVWDETDSKEKYRYCSKCQTPIYNFDGMERPEAEALIFNRENRNKFTLYGRKDGKFMTVDCPVQARRNKNLILSLVAGLALLLGAAALVMLIPPPPQPSETSPAATSDSPGSNASTDSGSGTPTKDANGMITFSSTSTRKPDSQRKSASGTSSAGGGGVQRFKLPSVNDQSAQAPDPDEDGHFWKFE
jgi:hypothetical protein